MQLEIDCYEWVIGKIEVNKIPFDRLERIIKATINDLEKRKDRAMMRTDTYNFWTKIESLQWVFVCYICHKKRKNGCNLRYSSIFLEDMESSAEKPK
jgi:hypothetical protein